MGTHGNAMGTHGNTWERYGNAWERMGTIRDKVHLRAQSYLTGLRSIIRSNHTHYTRLETKINEMSKSDPIALFYILEKSRAEIVTLANLEHD